MFSVLVCCTSIRIILDILAIYRIDLRASITRFGEYFENLLDSIDLITVPQFVFHFHDLNRPV